METRVVPVRPQVQWRVLLQRCAGDRHTLDGSWEHHRICGEKHPCGSVTFGKLKHYPWCQALAYFAFCHYQLLDVVKGIRYLHNCNIAHGDIKAVSPSSLTKYFMAKFTLFSAEHPRSGHQPTTTRSCRLRFHPRYNHLCETVDRRTGHGVFHGSRTPSSPKIQARQRAPV